MLPGPDVIVACPHCRGLARYRTLTSGNTFGARVWTDGKQVAPMLPRPPAVARCRHCGECFWLADAKEVGRVGGFGGGGDRGGDPAWASTESVEEPTADEYYGAIATGLAKGRMQERMLRMLAWWRDNDAFRSETESEAEADIGSSAVVSDAARSNLEALAELLDEEVDDDFVMKAEVLRELGRFDEATDLLNRVGSPRLRAVVDQFRSLCERKDARVRELRFDG